MEEGVGLRGKPSSLACQIYWSCQGRADAAGMTKTWPESLHQHHPDSISLHHSDSKELHDCLHPHTTTCWLLHYHTLTHAGETLFDLRMFFCSGID